MARPWILDYDSANCTIGATVDILGQRLSRLVDEGLLRKVPYQESGQRPRSEYRLTEKGLDLYPVLVAMMEWGDKYGVGSAGPQVLLRHRDCGEPVELQLACAAGHVLESAREVTPVPGPGARRSPDGAAAGV